MHVRTKVSWIAVLAAFAVLAITSTAAAQNPELGDTGQTWQQPADTTGQQQQGQQGQWGQQQQQPQQQQWGQQQQGGQWGQQQQQQQPPAQTEEQPPAAAADDDDEDEGQDDHEKVVGHLGVGYFGLIGVPLGAPHPITGTSTITVEAPTIGIRFWLAEAIGLDIALGFGSVSGNVDVDTPAGSDSQPLNQGLAFALHTGLPIALFHAQHYKFLITPELRIGVATGIDYDDSAIPGSDPNDADLAGFLLHLGARAGAEIHFGFIDVPQLSLQASVGAGLEYESVTTSDQTTDVVVSTLGLGTTVQNDPWNIFIADIAAIYYF